MRIAHRRCSPHRVQRPCGRQDGAPGEAYGGGYAAVQNLWESFLLRNDDDADGEQNARDQGEYR